MSARPHRQYTALAHIMTILAKESSEAIEHCISERQQLDGWPASTMSDGTPRGSSTSTTVERHAGAVLELDKYLDQMRDDVTAIASLASAAMEVCRQAKGHRAAKVEVEHLYCRDNQVKRDGVIEWGDVTCLNLPDKAGLCHACYLREWRYRKANNLGPRDVEAAA